MISMIMLTKLIINDNATYDDGYRYLYLLMIVIQDDNAANDDYHNSNNDNDNEQENDDEYAANVDNKT